MAIEREKLSVYLKLGKTILLFQRWLLFHTYTLITLVQDLSSLESMQVKVINY